MANEKDVFNQTTESLSNSDAARQLVDFEERLAILEKRVGRTTRELGPHSSNISKELEELHQELERMKASGIVQNLTDDLKRRCVYCGKGVYRKVCNSRNLSPNQIPNILMQWGVECQSQSSIKEWVIQQCNHCGNVQYFAVPGAPRPDTWG
jgi:hypothetical protein